MPGCDGAAKSVEQALARAGLTSKFLLISAFPANKKAFEKKAVNGLLGADLNPAEVALVNVLVNKARSGDSVQAAKVGKPPGKRAAPATTAPAKKAKLALPSPGVPLTSPQTPATLSSGGAAATATTTTAVTATTSSSTTDTVDRVAPLPQVRSAPRRVCRRTETANRHLTACVLSVLLTLSRAISTAPFATRSRARPRAASAHIVPACPPAPTAAPLARSRAMTASRALRRSK